MRSYKVAYGGAEWDAEEGDEIELDLTVEEEDEYVRRGRLVRLPQTYEVTGDNEVDGHKLGETFTADWPLGQELALIEGGHIKHSDAKAPAEMTKDDLIARADELGVEVKSSMKKDEIAEAIAAAKHEEGGNE